MADSDAAASASAWSLPQEGWEHVLRSRRRLPGKIPPTPLVVGVWEKTLYQDNRATCLERFVIVRHNVVTHMFDDSVISVTLALVFRSGLADRVLRSSAGRSPTYFPTCLRLRLRLCMCLLICVSVCLCVRVCAMLRTLLKVSK